MTKVDSNESRGLGDSGIIAFESIKDKKEVLKKMIYTIWNGSLAFLMILKFLESF